MVDLVPDENPLKSRLRGVQHLAAYATAYRYPTAVGRIKQSPDAATLGADLGKVEAVLLETASRFGVDLTRVGAPAATAQPIR